MMPEPILTQKALRLNIATDNLAPNPMGALIALRATVCWRGQGLPPLSPHPFLGLRVSSFAPLRTDSA
jgi:hypothetical protein